MELLLIHLLYMQSNKIHDVFFNEWIYSSRMLARRVSNLTGPSSGAFYKLYLQIWYVVIRVLLDTSSRLDVSSTRYLRLMNCLKTNCNAIFSQLFFFNIQCDRKCTYNVTLRRVLIFASWTLLRRSLIHCYHYCGCSQLYKCFWIILLLFCFLCIFQCRHYMKHR